MHGIRGERCQPSCPDRCKVTRVSSTGDVISSDADDWDASANSSRSDTDCSDDDSISSESAANSDLDTADSGDGSPKLKCKSPEVCLFICRHKYSSYVPNYLKAKIARG